MKRQLNFIKDEQCGVHMCSWVVTFSVFSCLRWGLKQLEIERRDGDSEEEAPEVAQAR